VAEFRTDPLRGHTVLINGQRGNRPSEFTLEIETPDESACAFCRGHEDATPPSIEQDRTPDWNWRLFPNRFPAVLEHPVPLVENEFTQAAIGRHEVLVESAHHYAQPHEYGVGQWVEIFQIWQRRLIALYAVEEIQYIHIFRNQGYRGGATLVHPHQQIVGLPLIPEAIAKRIEIVQRESPCPHCEWINREANDGVRVLENHEDMIAITAFAPRFPFEWQIYPKTHERFENVLNLAEKARASAGEDARTANLEGLSLMRLADSSKAVERLVRALELDSLLYPAAGSLALLYDAMDSMALSEKHYNIAIELSDSAAIYLNNCAYMYAVRGIKLEEAMALVDYALAKEPENSSYLDTKGWIFYQQGDYREALKWIKKALKKDEGSAALLEHIGDVYYAMGKKEQAREQWETAFAKDPNSSTLKEKLGR